MHLHAHFCILFFRFFRSRRESSIQTGFPHTSSLQVQDYIMTLNSGHEGYVVEIYLDTVFKTQVFIYLGNNKFFPHTFSHNFP